MTNLGSSVEELEDDCTKITTRSRVHSSLKFSLKPFLTLPVCSSGLEQQRGEGRVHGSGGSVGLDKGHI